MDWPSVLEVIEWRLAIEREHGYGVSWVHSVTKKLNTEAWRGLWLSWAGSHRLRDSHDAMLGASENSCVRAISLWSESDFKCHTNWMRHFWAIIGHCISNVIERKIHILREQWSELRSVKESTRALVFDHFCPDLTLLATCWLCQIFVAVKLFNLRECTWLIIILIRLFSLY